MSVEFPWFRIRRAAQFLTLLAIGLGAALGAAQAAEPCDEARVERVQATYQAMKSFSGRFE